MIYFSFPRYGRLFPYQTTQQRQRLLQQLIKALKESQPNKTSDPTDASHSNVASKSARNIIAALLCVVRHLSRGDLSLVTRGPGEKSQGGGGR